MKSQRNVEVYYNSLSSVHLSYWNERKRYYLMMVKTNDTRWYYTVFNSYPTFEEAKIELDKVLKPPLYPSDIWR